MSWCFAIVNNKLAEIYFDKTKGNRIKIWSHCYINKKDFKTKQEHKWIRDDIKRMKVIYRNKRYKLLASE